VTTYVNRWPAELRRILASFEKRLRGNDATQKEKRILSSSKLPMRFPFSRLTKRSKSVNEYHFRKTVFCVDFLVRFELLLLASR
jgi:hypothetical protein